MTTQRTFEVTFEVEEGDLEAIGEREDPIDQVMEKAMFIASDHLWARCSATKPWAIIVTEDDVEQPDMCYEFNPPEEDGDGNTR